MTISRGQMPRQLYEAGSMPANVEKMIQTIMEMTGVSREEAIRMIQTMENPQETMSGSNMMQEGYQLEPRQQYGLGSIVKSVSKAVKGVGDAVGDVVSSDLGKAALLAAGGYYLGGGALFGGPGFSMGNIGTSLFGTPLTLPPGMSTVSGGAFGSKGLIGAAGKFAPFSGSIASGLSGLSKGKLATLGIGGSSILAAIFGTPEEAQELAGRDPEAFNAKVKQYTKNLNPKESEKVLKQIQTDIAKLGDVKQAEQIFSRNVAADGGRIGLREGSSPNFNINERVSIANPLGFDVSVNAIDRGLTASEIATAIARGDEKGIAEALNPTISYSAEDIGGIKGLSFSAFSDLANRGLGLSYRNTFGKMPTDLSRFIDTGEVDVSGRGYRTFGIDDVNEDSVSPDASAGGAAGAAAASAAGANDGPDTGGSFAYGGRVMKEIGGIMGIPTGEPRMNQGGTPELDYRETGGFVPVGIKEKADDVPAMLSKNEFVFTADAVRGIGDGDVEKGAQILYDNMKRYENRMV